MDLTQAIRQRLSAIGSRAKGASDALAAGGAPGLDDETLAFLLAALDVQERCLAEVIDKLAAGDPPRLQERKARPASARASQPKTNRQPRRKSTRNDNQGNKET